MLNNAVVFLFSLAAASVAAILAGSPSASSSYQACSASMDGQLPAMTPADFQYSGNIRRYYVAAEEVDWNYAPTGWDNWLGVPINVSPRAMQSTKYNTTYTKALYRGYTDASFSEPSEQPPWQGTQGPTLRSEVGDMVEIMSKNNEGADYPFNPVPGQNSNIPPNAAVPPVDSGIGPGECVVYKWLANEESGPNGDQPARAHSYHSYIDLKVDTNSGLIGPQIVYASGQMEATMQNYKEFPLLYMIYGETSSFLSAENAMQLGGEVSMSPFGSIDQNLWQGNYSIWHPQVVNLASSGRFPDASNFHSLNGYIFANNHVFEMCQDEQVIWYTYGYGSEAHVFHLHGNSFVYEGNKMFAVALNPGESKTLYMTPVDAGMWQIVCHVNGHHQMGMVANYLVKPAGQCGSGGMYGGLGGGSGQGSNGSNSQSGNLQGNHGQPSWNNGNGRGGHGQGGDWSSHGK